MISGIFTLRPGRRYNFIASKVRQSQIFLLRAMRTASIIAVPEGIIRAILRDTRCVGSIRARHGIRHRTLRPRPHIFYRSSRGSNCRANIRSHFQAMRIMSRMLPLRISDLRQCRIGRLRSMQPEGSGRIRNSASRWLKVLRLRRFCTTSRRWHAFLRSTAIIPTVRRRVRAICRRRSAAPMDCGRSLRNISAMC